MDWLLSVDYWAERYQTLLIGVLAIVVAWRQTTIMKLQTDIMDTQEKLVSTQNEQQIQIAMLSLDHALVTMERLLMEMISAATHQEVGRDADGGGIFTWAPSLLPRYIYDFTVDWDQSQAALAVAQRFPEYLDDFHKAVTALADLKDLGERHKAKPWEDYDAELHPEANEPFNAFFRYVGKVLPIGPGYRDRLKVKPTSS
jgi:hypothetical protein